jgi:putative transposase
VERLMRRMGLRGVRRGQVMRTTLPNSPTPYPEDRVNRPFQSERPNPLWVADFTDVSMWQGVVHVALVIDVLARYRVGGRVSRSCGRTSYWMRWSRPCRPVNRPAMAPPSNHSDRGTPYVSIRYRERLAEADIEPSVGSTGDSADHTLAETINGLYKAEVIHRCGPWKTAEAVEPATLQWVAWFNHQRLLEPIGYIPPAEAEANYSRQLTEQTVMV